MVNRVVHWIHRFSAIVFFSASAATKNNVPSENLTQKLAHKLIHGIAIILAFGHVIFTRLLRQR
jgi:hypothetical protein